MTQCPCGSGQDLDDCCGAMIAGAPAPTAEALMRARYTAFALGQIDYLADTLAPEARGDFDPIEAGGTASDAVWQSLEGAPSPMAVGMTRPARWSSWPAFACAASRACINELARFRREQGRWVCAGGDMNPKAPPRQVVKVGRNDPCPCGSGKKYKKCCGA